jgi:hypothetical protein
MYYVILFTGHMQQMPGVFLAHIRILQLYAQKRGDFTKSPHLEATPFQWPWRKEAFLQFGARVVGNSCLLTLSFNGNILEA